MKQYKIISLLLCMAVILGMLVFTANASDNDAVEVTFAAQKDGAFIFIPQTVTVTDGIAEEYGYAVSEKDHNEKAIEEATVFDALVAVHKAKYGDSFTPETAENYLKITSGFLTKAFGADASSSGFKVNSAMLADESGWGYAVDAARLTGGDVIEYWFYQDTKTWSDCYTCFDQNEVTVGAGVSFELTMSKLAYDSNWNESLVPIDGTDSENTYITVNTVKSDGSIGEALKNSDGSDITPDANGKITLAFDTVGTYTITAQGFVNGTAPIVAPFCVVTVGENITFAAQKDGAFIFIPQTVTVTDGIAEEYGYAVSEKDHNEAAIEEATVFDALVAVHKAKYGDSFTPTTAEDYLKISSGFITKAFGADASASGFKVNSAMLADESGWGYAADAARLTDGDVIEYWFYQDTKTWSDCYTTFDKNEVTVDDETSFQLTMSKLAYDQNWNESLVPVDGTDADKTYITVNTVKSNGSIGEALKNSDGSDITPDANGKITLEFDMAGTYTVTAQGFVNGTAPIVAPFCVVTVTTDSLAGDVDGDGSVKIRDAALILQHIAGWDVTIDKSAANVDGNDSLTVRDAAIILQYIAGWDVAFAQAK